MPEPACDGKEGLIAADLSAPPFYEGYRILVPAESDTVLTQRYAGKLIRKLDLLRSIGKDLPEDRAFVWFFRREDDETARKRILARKPFRYTNRFAEYRLEKKETRAHGSRITFAYRAEHTGAWGRITVTEKKGTLAPKTFRIQVGAEEDLSATLPCGHRICRKFAEDANGADLRENAAMAKIQSGEVRFVSRDRFPCNIRTKKAENAVSAESAKKAKRKKNDTATESTQKGKGKPVLAASPSPKALPAVSPDKKIGGKSRHRPQIRPNAR